MHLSQGRDNSGEAEGDRASRRQRGGSSGGQWGREWEGSQAVVINLSPLNRKPQGMLEGKRSKGKQREKLIEGMTDWLKAGKSLEAIEATKDRKKWRTMIANAVKQGT
ncbi:hypothetical protein PoB_007210600 [Plakobranchus ocellatus]|uniref:Uncharacterized protein n=1 Tax=Plakobranchus ocellatus TaxID=259542 RepID=A0AAV4DP04_9GAST|nr:hypothetical protein PoB_007210600 [Plakobranchus ocellatus]